MLECPSQRSLPGSSIKWEDVSEVRGKRDVRAESASKPGVLWFSFSWDFSMQPGSLPLRFDELTSTGTSSERIFSSLLNAVSRFGEQSSSAFIVLSIPALPQYPQDFSTTTTSVPITLTCSLTVVKEFNID